MEEKNVLEGMIERAKDARKIAYAPYSKHAVGACVRSESGRLIKGCNVENASYGLTQCAEAVAIAHMICHDEQKICEMVIYPASPCGACRQMIKEFGTPETKIHVVDKNDEITTYSIEELLPHSFDLDH